MGISVSLKKYKWAALIEYDGAAFHGWQTQSNVVTIQEAIEGALSRIAGETISIVCAGRTDKGVHACGQVIHFETNAERNNNAWLRGTNTWTSRAISMVWCQPIVDEFHARFSATSRHYRYVIYNHAVAPTWLRPYVSWYHRELNAGSMHEAAQYLLGENDFTSFRASGCQASTPMRCMHSINVKRHGDYIYIDLHANAFLYHMVRNIVGTLLPIGYDQQPVRKMGEILDAKDRSKAGATAYANGLYLTKVDYPGKFGISKPRELVRYH